MDGDNANEAVASQRARRGDDARGRRLRGRARARRRPGLGRNRHDLDPDDGLVQQRPRRRDLRARRPQRAGARDHPGERARVCWHSPLLPARAGQLHRRHRHPRVPRAPGVQPPRGDLHPARDRHASRERHQPRRLRLLRGRQRLPGRGRDGQRRQRREHRGGGDEHLPRRHQDDEPHLRRRAGQPDRVARLRPRRRDLPDGQPRPRRRPEHRHAELTLRLCPGLGLAGVHDVVPLAVHRGRRRHPLRRPALLAAPRPHRAAVGGELLGRPAEHRLSPRLDRLRLPQLHRVPRGRRPGGLQAPPRPLRGLRG